MKTVRTPWKQLTLRIPPDVHRALKIHVAETGGGMSELVEGLIRQYLIRGDKRAGR